MTTSDITPRVWFITGTSTGLGRAVAEIALEKGEIVVATAHRPSTLDDLAQQHPKERLLILPLDVTQRDQVVDAFAKATRTFGCIDIVFNNAGLGDVGEFEGMEEPKARGAILETNFWGAVSVTKEAVKCFRKSNAPGVGGRLLQMSSYLGLVGLPTLSFYCASKFALEGASETLAAELDPAWNIKITIIEPGWIRTAGSAKGTWSPEHPAYQNPDLPTTHVRSVRWDEVTAWKDAKRSVEVFYKIACVPNPPLHFVVGKDAIEATRKKIAALIADIDAYEAFSEGLEE